MNDPDTDIIETANAEVTDSNYPTSAPSLALQFDARKFVHHLAAYDLTDAQRLVYIETIWSIVLQFVDLGFGVHPVQLACGQGKKDADLSSKTRSNALKSFHSETGPEPVGALSTARRKRIPGDDGKSKLRAETEAR